jgi:pimeloyl-ACP methyl ester carboxylesterase
VSSTIPRSLVLLGWAVLVACGTPSDQSTSPPAEPQATPTADAYQRPQVPVLNWVPCGDEFPGAECAVAEVPLDYDRPRGAKVGIALARLRAADQAHKVGSIFINPGGPGGSGVDQALSSIEYFHNVFGPAVGDRLDLVGFDPRGVARSEPLLCFDTLAEEDAFLASFPQWWTFPYLKDQERPFFEAWRWYAAQCLGQGQRIAAHMSTADVARDLDLLRQAVGDERLTYLGFSYGTYIGQTYANLFPGRIRAMVIDGVLNPRTYSSGWNILYWQTSTDEAFQEYLRICDAAGTAADGQYYCPLGGPDGAAARWDAFLASLKRSPLELPDGSIFNYDMAVVAGLLAIYDPFSWTGPDGWTTYFASLADYAELRDSTAGTRAVEVGRAVRTRLAKGATQQELYGNQLDASYGSACADAEYPDRFETWSQISALVASHSTFGPDWWWDYGTPCATWPTNADRYTGPWEVRTSAPVLVVGNYFDGVTDYSGAVVASKLLKGSRLLSFAGLSHTAFGYSDCASGYIERYLADGTLPPAGTVCPALPNPYLPQPALRAAQAPRPPSIRPPAWMIRRFAP